VKIVLATPCYGGQVTEPYMQSVLRLVFAGLDGIDIAVLTTTGESLITRARNAIVAQFMAGDGDALLFVDADIEFQPENVRRLVDSGHPVCATPYPMKAIDWDRVVAARPATVVQAREAGVYSVVNAAGEPGPDGFAPVLDAGTGFMLIHRRAIDLMCAAMPELAYQSDQIGMPAGTQYALFDTSIDAGRYLSEDYTFCRRWQRLGGLVMADIQGPALHHHGHYTFGG